ncbi:hypothetical protein [Coraliomargarita parva]|uniref:hypothetical protein n=1 Tax=Coraliomargarita parva TaxID=3014050 RepID=UPI0022B2B454|nr:hypothetical protein [Coraliomargarita parva]
MDTDTKLIRQAKSFFKKSSARLACARYAALLDSPEAERLLRNAILEGQPFLAGRVGSNEARITSKYLRGQAYSPEERFRITQHAGVFPDNVEAIDAFARTYADAFGELDLLGTWYPRGEAYLINRRGPSSLQLAPLRVLEPYYSSSPWSSALEGKRVLVVHPFKASILSQYRKRSLLFDDPVLPEFATLEVVQAVQSIAGEDPGFPDWGQALESMKTSIEALDCDVVIIGAGAYGLPLAAHAKRLGKVAIHLGGATQVLFGIKGRRWDGHPVVSRLYNEHWCRPGASERPEKGNIVEGGTYW